MDIQVSTASSCEPRKDFDFSQMPNLDGLQSTRLIREMGYSAPIVALTAFSEESNIKDCYDSGMNHFLSKPIRRPALKQVLKQFATIPEENESNSLTKSSTKSESRAPTPPLKAELIQPTANGISHWAFATLTYLHCLQTFCFLVIKIPTNSLSFHISSSCLCIIAGVLVKYEFSIRRNSLRKAGNGNWEIQGNWMALLCWWVWFASFELAKKALEWACVYLRKMLCASRDSGG